MGAIMALNLARAVRNARKTGRLYEIQEAVHRRRRERERQPAPEDDVDTGSWEQHAAAVSADRGQRRCPQCGEAFLLVRRGDVELDHCDRCDSWWFDGGELGKLAGTSQDVPGDHLRSRPGKYDCPVCGEHMTEFQYHPRENLLVDACPHGHGVYLESGEFDRALRAAH